MTMTEQKLTKMGNPVGATRRRELLGKPGVDAVDQPDGVRLTTADPEFESQMEVARRVMRERRAVLRELAK
jgi:hypothetical protein